MSESCTPHHDWFTATLTFGLCCGLVISYVPQLYRIVHKGSSEGFSPWFLLLGSTSAASGFFNMITMQWRVARCCAVLSMGSCLETVAGIIQVGLQWLFFTSILVLYMLYYPTHLKYNDVHFDGPPVSHIKNRVRTSEWNLSINLSCVVVIHFLFAAFITFYILLVNPLPSSLTAPLPAQVASWATFLGISSGGLTAVQYAPQLIHTYKTKLVGALSIPMMCLQSPGGVLMVLSIALRPGTNWTSWISFAIAAMMQSVLLFICIAWTRRQRRLGIDEFGNPLDGSNVNADFRSFGEDEDLTGPIGEETPLVGRIRGTSHSKGLLQRLFG